MRRWACRWTARHAIRIYNAELLDVIGSLQQAEPLGKQVLSRRFFRRFSVLKTSIPLFYTEENDPYQPQRINHAPP